MSSSATLSHRAEYAALRTVTRLLEGTSIERAAAIGGWIGGLGYRPLSVRRRVVERQVAAAFPELDPETARHVARGAYENLGRVAAESALLAKRGAPGVIARVSACEGWNFVEEGQASGRGLILVGGHLGNWELSAAYVGARGRPLDVVTRRMANPLVDRYLTSTRTRLGMTVVQDHVAARRCLRTLKAGGTVGFLVDQGVLNLASTWVPFFGRPAKTPRGPAVFALRVGSPVVFFTMLREPDGSYRAFFEPVPVAPPTGDLEQDVNAIAASYTATLERYVRRVPEQYFWQHRRWKWQPDDTPPHLRDPSA